jgi:tyrosyl-tRNA synthetase
LVTPLTPPEIAAIENGVKEGSLHPRDAKMRLAFEIVTAFYGRAEAENAQKSFVETFQKGGVPEEIAEFKLDPTLSISELLVSAGLAKSKNEARRLIDQRGVKFEGDVLNDSAMVLQTPGVLQVGKRHFLRLVQ